MFVLTDLDTIVGFFNLGPGLKMVCWSFVRLFMVVEGRLFGIFAGD